MNSNLRNKLIKASILGAFPLAAVLISYFEGVRYYPYCDVAGVLTVCYGHTGNDIDKNKRYSQGECEALFEADLLKHKNGVDLLLETPLPDTALAALYSFSYNVGLHAFAESTLLKKLNAGEKEKACGELRRWIYAAGQPWKGLIARRQVEEALCQLDNIDEI